MAPAKQRSKKKSASLPRTTRKSTRKSSRKSTRKSSHKNRKGSAKRRSGSKKRGGRFRGENDKKRRFQDVDQEEPPEEPPSEEYATPISADEDDHIIKKQVEEVVEKMRNEFSSATYEEYALIVNSLFVALERRIVEGPESHFRAAAASAAFSWIQNAVSNAASSVSGKAKQGATDLFDMAIQANAWLLELEISTMEKAQDKLARVAINNPVVFSTASTGVIFGLERAYNHAQTTLMVSDTPYAWFVRVLSGVWVVKNYKYFDYFLMAMVAMMAHVFVDVFNKDPQSRLWSRGVGLLSRFYNTQSKYGDISDKLLTAIITVTEEMKDDDRSTLEWLEEIDMKTLINAVKQIIRQLIEERKRQQNSVQVTVGQVVNNSPAPPPPAPRNPSQNRRSTISPAPAVRNQNPNPRRPRTSPGRRGPP